MSRDRRLAMTLIHKRLRRLEETRYRKDRFTVEEEVAGTLSPRIACRLSARYMHGTLFLHSRGPSEQKPFKISGENGAWAYPGTAQIFEVPPIISGMGKATNVKFGRYIQRVHRNKSQMERGCIQGLPKFFEYPLLSQERVKLRTSNLAGIFRVSMRTKASEASVAIWLACLPADR